MAYFPFMIEVESHKALVVGAGQSAKEKIRSLTDFGADVTVVAPVISADVVKQGKNIKIERRVYRPGETKGYEIVVAATDNPAVNKQVAHDAARFGAICSVSGDPERGGFVFPQIIKRNMYSVAVCTEGMDSRLAAKLKEKIEDAVPEKADEIAALFSKARKKLDEQNKTGAEDAGSVRTRLADIRDEANSAKAAVTSGGSSVIQVHDGSEEHNRIDAEAGGADSIQPDLSETVSVMDDSEEECVIRVGTLPDRLSQVRADAVISSLEAEGHTCSKVLFECPGTIGIGRLDESKDAESTTIMNAEDALINKKIDLAVRRAAELPDSIPDVIDAARCLPREDARDVLVTKKGTDENEIEVIETDDPARKAQIEKFLRNGEARLSSEGIQVIINHIKSGEADAAILPASDLERLLFTEDDELECEYIDIDKSLPPVCQGITVLETRKSGKAYEAAAVLSDDAAEISLAAERSFKAVERSSEDDVIAAYSAINSRMLFMKVMKKTRQRCVYFSGMDEPKNAELLGKQLAEKIDAVYI